MKTILSRFAFVVLFLFPALLQAQQDAMYTQYMFNTVSVNPAYAGSKEAMSAMLLAREQWVGIDGAPSTQTFTLHAPVKKEKIGLGISAINDRIGPVRETGVFLDFAFQFPVTDRARLSLGAKGGFNSFNARLSEIGTVQSNDPAFQKDISGRLLPNFGFGMFYFTNKYYLGFSVPKLIRNEISINDDVITGSAGKEERHAFFIGGYVFNVNTKLKFKPSFLVKAVSGSPLSVDLTANFLIDERLWLGGAYRIGDALGGLVQLRINQQLWVGYAYEFTLNELRPYHSGTHEVLLSFDFQFSNSDYRVKSPRYF